MPIRVVLADDHAVVRDGLRLVLEAAGDIQVVGDVDNGRKAVVMVQEATPDVAVLDVAMPELNGIEAARQIRAACPKTQVVMLSMYATAEHVYRALQAGACGYVLKESAGKEVVRAVRAARDGTRYLSLKIAETVIDEFVLRRQGLPEKSPLERLSSREREILQLVVEGRSSAQIAETIYLSPKTVETYRSRLMQKLGVNDVPGLVKFAIQHGLTVS